MEENIQFVPYEQVNSIFEIGIDEISYKNVMDYFLTHLEEEVIYICNKRVLKAVVTLGDLFRFDREQSCSFMNQNYQFLQRNELNDFEKMNYFFEKYPTIFEIPIINDKKLLVGIYKKKGYYSKEQKWNRLQKFDVLIDRTLDSELYIDYLIKNLKFLKTKIPDLNIYIYPTMNTLPEKWSPMLLQHTDYKKYLKKISKKNYDREIEGLKRGFFFDFSKINWVIKDGFIGPEDFSSNQITIKNKHRVTPNVIDAPKKIFMIGPCIIFGAYVDDYHTIEYFLQEKLNEYKLPYQVINCGLLGYMDLVSNLFAEKITSEDIVVFYTQNPMIIKAINFVFPNAIMQNWNTIYEKLEDPFSHCLDSINHCDYLVKKEIANYIWDDIRNDLSKDICCNKNRNRIQEYYIPFDIHKYFDIYMKKYQLKRIENKTIGSIVMNCNPFTLGHRALIEKAKNEVDVLYIFVVEEDESYFSFLDRISMVKKGTEDIDNVIVIPSGRFIISKNTFPQYFDKDIVDVVQDMSMDIRIFGEVLAPKLNITRRFVGEEPNDAVTNKYNKLMRNILIEYNIEVIEYPRILTEGSCQMISASVVRKYCKGNAVDYKKLEEFCPITTIEYLKKIRDYEKSL